MQQSGIEIGKERITITIDKELLEWVDAKVKDKTFANRSHALEYLMRQKKSGG